MNEIDDIGENNTEEINYGCCRTCFSWKFFWKSNTEKKRCINPDSNLYFKETEMDDTCKYHSEEVSNE